MVLSSDFDIRFTEEGDYDFLSRWVSVEGGSDPFPFAPDEKEGSLKNWIAFSQIASSLTGTWKGVPCAISTLFLMPYKKVAHHCSFYLLVDPAYRRQGIGASMLKNILHLGKTKFRLESVHVELFEPSDLLPLLEKVGFQLFARQENFMHWNGKERARLLLEHFF